MNKSPLNILVNGAHGRMGRRIVALARNNRNFDRIVEFTRADNDLSTVPDNNTVDVVIDFSTPDALNHAVEAANHTNAALLVGTTGLNDEQKHTLRARAEQHAVMLAPNTSLGVAVMKVIARQTAIFLGDDAEIDVFDAHHNQKKDAPSGTALALIDAIHDARPGAVTDDRVHCTRAGAIVGRHTTTFTTPFEEIAITHNALTRDVFAAGALHAAQWLAGQTPGMYVIEDALCLTQS